jgi:hypothetical protein
MVRVKQRYILGEILIDENNVVVDIATLTNRKILDSFRASIQEYYGDLGHAKITSNFKSKEASFLPDL